MREISFMPDIERTIQVGFRLRVFFTREAFAPDNDLLKQVICGEQNSSPSASASGITPMPRAHKVLVVLDESIAKAQPDLSELIQQYFAALAPAVELVCAPMVIEGGERTKNSFFHVSEIHSQIERYHVDRHSYVIAIGGGALLDMVGLAAATAHRGVRHIRIPSTTLSQGDSGVGVKNGINAFGKKNFIGTFAPPYAVINDFSLLDSLPERDKRAGYSEAVKVALIRDAEFFSGLESQVGALARFETRAMEWLIRRSAELHLNHIAGSGDPFETGSARPLDFGHWSAHKMEQLSEYRIRHGEAVAIGLALDVVYSRLMGYITLESEQRVLRLLEGMGFELFAGELLHTDASHTSMLLLGLEEFREHLGGQLAITLLRGIGKGFETDTMHPARVLEAVEILRARHEASSRIQKVAS